jgi:hypothetical protein
MIRQKRLYTAQPHIPVVCTIVQWQNKLTKAFKGRMIHDIPNRTIGIHIPLVSGDNKGSGFIGNVIISG